MRISCENLAASQQGKQQLECLSEFVGPREARTEMIKNLKIFLEPKIRQFTAMVELQKFP